MSFQGDTSRPLALRNGRTRSKGKVEANDANEASLRAVILEQLKAISVEAQASIYRERNRAQLISGLFQAQAAQPLAAADDASDEPTNDEPANGQG